MMVVYHVFFVCSGGHMVVVYHVFFVYRVLYPCLPSAVPPALGKSEFLQSVFVLPSVSQVKLGKKVVC